MTLRIHALEEMTFAEFRERMAEPPVILPPFAIEQEQGPHPPMGEGMIGGDARRGSAEVGAAMDETIIDIVGGFVMLFRRRDPSNVMAGPRA